MFAKYFLLPGEGRGKEGKGARCRERERKGERGRKRESKREERGERERGVCKRKRENFLTDNDVLLS